MSLMLDPAIAQAIAAGGDVGVWALLAVLWRFDRRLLAVESGVKYVRELWATFGPHLHKATTNNQGRGEL